MQFTADNLLTNEIARDAFYRAIPLPFRMDIKAEADRQIKAIVKTWQKNNSRDKVAKMKAEFKTWAAAAVDAVNDYKPLNRKHAFNDDALNHKAALLSNDLYKIQTEYSHYFNVNENASEADQRGALMAMAEVYKRFFRLTLTGLTEDYIWKNKEQREGVIKIEPLDLDKFLADDDYQAEILSTILKALKPEWWVQRYRKEFKRMAEEFAVRCGLVSKKKGQIYCTNHCLNQVKQSDRRNQLFLEGIEIERDDGFTVSLAEVIKHSLSNPYNRHAQLMARIAGLEKLGKHENLHASFYTITAPSRFHKNSPKYDGSTPNQAREYLQKTWERIRAKIKRQEIYHFGVRVAEAHKDACPHWHLMLWCKPGEQNRLDSIFKEHALKADQDELLKDGVFYFEPGFKARKKGVVFRTPRLEIKRMLPELGHPTGYIIKYISKNIKAHDESAAPDNVLTYADRVNAWARTHRIRQFQFIGDEQVSAWNEARRISPEIIKEKSLTLTERAAEFVEVCRSNDWFKYVLLMREMAVKVNKRTFRDADSDTFSKKTEILGLTVAFKNPMREAWEQLKEQSRGGYGTATANAVLSKLPLIIEDGFNTRFYTWTKSARPPDRA